MKKSRGNRLLPFFLEFCGMWGIDRSGSPKKRCWVAEKKGKDTMLDGVVWAGPPGGMGREKRVRVGLKTQPRVEGKRIRKKIGIVGHEW